MQKLGWKIDIKFPCVCREVCWHPESNIPLYYWVVFTYLGRALSLWPCTGFTPETNFSLRWARAPLLGLSSMLSEPLSVRSGLIPTWHIVVPKTLLLWSIITMAWPKTSRLFTPYKHYTLTTKNCFALHPPAWSTDAGHCIPCLSLCPQDVGPGGANTARAQMTSQSNKVLPWIVGPCPVCGDVRRGARFKVVSNDLPLCCWKLT